VKRPEKEHVTMSHPTPSRAPLPDPELTVVGVRHHRHRAPLLRPFVTAQRRTEAVEYVVAEVELAGGAVGQGSAAETVAVTGESADTIARALAGPLRSALEGASGPLSALSGRVAAALPKDSSARAALDVALHDAAARSLGVPVMRLLGADAPGATGAGATATGPGRPAPGDTPNGMLNDMTVSLEDPEVMAGHAREAVADGQRILKIKLGRDVDQDRRRLAAVLEAAPDVRLRLDANQGWDADRAITIITGLEADGLPIDLVEQPVSAADVDGLARVRAGVRTPVMADEAVWTADDARRLVAAGAADMLNIKLAKTGGLRQALAVADVAAEAGITCMVGSMMEPRISITAAAHLALAHPAITMIDLDAPAWFTSDLPRGGFVQDGAELRLTGGPGLGLELLRQADDAPADVTRA
jgi:L-alanine-DL-glutamate epimerase-like enolase superfamily enzyme